MASALQDREKSFGLKLGWNSNQLPEKIERKGGKPNQATFLHRKHCHAKIAEIQNFLSHWNRRASEGRGEHPLLQEIFKAPRKDKVGSSLARWKRPQAVHPESFMLFSHTQPWQLLLSSALLHPEPATGQDRHCSFILLSWHGPAGAKGGMEGKREHKARGSPRQWDRPRYPPSSPGAADSQSSHRLCPSLRSALLFGSAAEESSLRPAERRGRE